MGIVNKIFGNVRKDPSTAPEHAVIVHFRYGHTNLQPIFDLEDALEAAITAAGVVEFDGNDIAQDGSDGHLYMYGPDADRLFAAVKPILASVDFMQGATVRLRYGPPEDGVEERKATVGG